MAKLPDRVVYTVWCDDRGKVLDDGTLFRLSDSEFHLCSQERHLCWLQDSALGFDVAVDAERQRLTGSMAKYSTSPLYAPLKVAL